jgi:hypothetical protein
MGFLAGIATVRSASFEATDYRDREKPPPQPNMPGGADAKVVPALHPFTDFELDLAAITTPIPGRGSRAAGGL